MHTHTTPIDISNNPELMRLAEEVARTKKPRELVRDSKPVAMLMPMAAVKKAKNMKYLVDSDYVADYLVARPSATELLSSLAIGGISISLLTVGEIYEGIYYGYHPEEGTIRFQRFACIRGELRRTGNIIGDFDILIGATALQHKLTLVTRNLRDYNRIPNLDIYKAS